MVKLRKFMVFEKRSGGAISVQVLDIQQDPECYHTRTPEEHAWWALLGALPHHWPIAAFDTGRELHDFFEQKYGIKDIWHMGGKLRMTIPIKERPSQPQSDGDAGRPSRGRLARP
jgi:hypothetical protein